ncbi:MAG: hypothetical protein K6F77_04645 [Lachnospiraceae bacterium]|nr:hypothetical protein [Lachnospiraceae bacterium]
MFKKTICFMLTAGLLLSQPVYNETFIGTESEKVASAEELSENDKNLSEILCELKGDFSLSNENAFLEDNSLSQIANEVKTSYALKYLNESLSDTEISDATKIIAADSVVRDGDLENGKYTEITEYVSKNNISQILNSSNGLYIYKTNMAAVKELMEWSASVYSNDVTVTITSGSAVSPSEEPADTTDTPVETQAAEETAEPLENSSGTAVSDADAGMKSATDDSDNDKSEVPTSSAVIIPSGSSVTKSADIIKDGWKSSLENYMVFDGIEYKIDITKAAKYSVEGQIQNTGASRISNLTINGKEVSSDEKVILVSEKLPEIGLASADKFSVLASLDASDYRQYGVEFFEEFERAATLYDTRDYNWSLIRDDEVDYYFNDKLMDFGDDNSNLPFFNIYTVADNATLGSVKAKLYASAKAEIKGYKVLKGKYKKTSLLWNDTDEIGTNQYKITSNSIYSFLAIDKNGNSSLKYVYVDDIDTSKLPKPVVNYYTNTDSKITGTGIAMNYIYIETPDKVYKESIDASGNFSYSLPAQKAGTKLTVYQENTKGDSSDKTVVEVHRNGPNKPTVNEITTKSRTISGNLNDTGSFPAVLVDSSMLYVPTSGGQEFYISSVLYKEGYAVDSIDVSVDDEGNFSMDLPKTLTVDNKVTIFTYDIQNRISLYTDMEVNLVKPKKPTVDTSTVNNRDKKVKVYSDELVKITITMKGKTYTSSNGTYKKKKCSYLYKIKVPRTDSGVKLKFYATNDKCKSNVKTVTRTEVVPDTPKITYASKYYGRVSGKIDIVGNENGNPTLANTNTKAYVIIGNKKHKVKLDSKGKFSYSSSKIKGAGKVYVQGKNLNGKSKKKKVKF